MLRKMIRALTRLGTSFVRPSWWRLYISRKVWSGWQTKAPELSAIEIVEGHFQLFSSREHKCRKGMEVALLQLNGAPANIVETGTSAWGTDSSRLWAKYVNTFGGTFSSVDLRPAASRRLGDLGPRVQFHVGDSVSFLQTIASQPASQPAIEIDLLYLDSADVDWENPEAAAEHGYREWKAAQPLLRSGSIVVIDDTPKTIRDLGELTDGALRAIRSFQLEKGVLPGKGALVLVDLAKSKEWEVLHHTYNLVVRKT